MSRRSRRWCRRPAMMLSMLLMLAALGCAREPVPPPAAGESGEASFAIDMARAALVDLSHPFDESTLYWPTSPSAFELEQLAFGETEAGFFYAANRFCTPEHGGTHLDAPIHFARGAWTAAEIPLERLSGPGVVIDVASSAAADADYLLTPADVEAWERRHGVVPPGAIVFLRTGWTQRWGDRRSYFGDDTPGDASNLHFPSYGVEAARLLIEERGVAALGVDTASIDHGPSTGFAVHRLAGAANVPGLENVALSGDLPATGTWVLALPVKIAGGSGGPVRVVALVPETKKGDDRG